MECKVFSETPISALRGPSKTLISRLLNATKVIPSPSGLPRDWRGLADIAEYNHSLLAGCLDPTASVLAFWQKSQPTIAQLIDALKEIDRWDVIDDSLQLLESDAENYAESLQVSTQPCIEDQNGEIVLTVDDPQCIENCGKPQYYDAFLLYDDSDEVFAMTILEKLEDDYKMKLCTKERDLVGGVSFEHEAIMQLIRYRCKRLIVVVSPSFLNSPANQFLLTFAQALGIEQRQRKIIPCTYSNCQLPLQLRYHFILNFGRSAKHWDLWRQLSQSIRATKVSMIPHQEVSRPIIHVEEPKAITNGTHSEEAKAITNGTYSEESIKAITNGTYSQEPTKAITNGTYSEEPKAITNGMYSQEPTKAITNGTYSEEPKAITNGTHSMEITINETKTNEKVPKMSSSSSTHRVSKLFSSSLKIGKSLFKKEKKLAKVLAE